jgi:N-acetylglucosamine-6-phosphate deacetylase
MRANVPGSGFHEIDMEDGRIVRSELTGPKREDALYCWRGFVDIQINGFAGVDFGADESAPEYLVAVLEPLFSTGITSFFPTLITNEIERLVSQLRTFEKTRKKFPVFARAVPGYHLEGPWLSPGPSHGAHDPERMRLPDWDDFEHLQEAASGRIRLITIAPELPGALDFIQRARVQGIAVAIGHTDGTREDVYRAVAAGAMLSTHLGNGCPQTLDRHTAPFWAQLADDRLKACIVCDNFHVTPEVIRIITRVKGLSNCSLVTDAMQAAMMPPGVYKIAITTAELLPTGQVVRLDRKSMAGSALTMDRAVANFRQATGCSLVEALNAATTNPLIALGCTEAAQGIASGQPADLILFETNQGSVRVRETILGGELVWKS